VRRAAFPHCLKENGVGLPAAAIRDHVIRFKEHGINFRQANRPDDFHVRGSPSLQASQLVTVECDELVGFDLLAAQNVRSADRLLIARCNQRLSDASDRSGTRRCFGLRLWRGGFKARDRDSDLGGSARVMMGSIAELRRFGSVDVMQANALLPRCTEQFHGN
jgi:hypothetical protein